MNTRKGYPKCRILTGLHNEFVLFQLCRQLINCFFKPVHCSDLYGCSDFYDFEPEFVFERKNNICSFVDLVCEPVLVI